jgi:NADH-quinone oxidoreductase subunit N
MDLGNLESLLFIAPELVLVGTALALFLVDLVVRDSEHLGDIALGGLALALVAMAVVPHELSGWLFGRMLFHDPFSSFFEVIIALSAMVTVWLSIGSAEVRRMSQGEYYGLLVSGAVGAILMGAAANLLIAYLAMELLSIVSYVLTGFVRHDRRSGEAALKYLIYGGVASGVMLYGMSWLFGLCGSLDLVVIHGVLESGDPEPLTLFLALVLTLAGLGFKISMVPFHMWAPDVYQGAPIPVVAFLAVASKAAGLALLIRLLFPTFSAEGSGGAWHFLAGVDWPQLLLVLSAVTMTLGNLAALQQRELKRLLAYSGVAHAGYLLMGLVALSDQGLQAVLFYVIAYYFMNLGAFAVLILVHNESGSDSLDAFRGLAWRGGALPAVAMAVFLFSLIGVPPFVGFFGKFYLFAAVIEQKLYALALIGVLNSVVSVGYYFQILRAMFLEAAPEGAGRVEATLQERALIVVLLAGTCVFGVWSGPVHAFARYSLQFFGG